MLCALENGIINIREIMLVPVTVYGVSLLPPGADSFSDSSPKPVPFLSYNASFFPTHCVVILGDMVCNGWFVEFLLWSFPSSSDVMLQTSFIWFFFVFFFSGLKLLYWSHLYKPCHNLYMGFCIQCLLFGPWTSCLWDVLLNS